MNSRFFTCFLCIFMYIFFSNYKISMSQKNLLQFFKRTPKEKRPLSSLSGNEENSDKKPKIQDEGITKPFDSEENKMLTDLKNDAENLETEKENKTSQPKNLETLKSQKTMNFEPDVNIVKQEIIETCKKLPIVDPQIGHSWYKALKPEFKKPYFQKLNDFVLLERKSHTIFPPPNKVWTWTKECSLEDVKVVILGQDPYHNPGQAHGLCFSVEIGTKPPPSLLNMYKELATDIDGFKAPQHGYLIGWARQGVLLLNACLTVRKNQPNSHKDKGWEDLTTSVIKYINERRDGIVFLLWGSYAQKKADFVNKKKHHVLKTVHPSPLSSSRGWFGSKHFSKCNDILKSMGKKPIDWADLPAK